MRLSIDSLFGNWFDSWLQHHPILHWLTQHPFISFIGISISLILLIRLFVTLYRAIANSIDRLWLWILRSPLLLLKFLFGWEFKSQNTSASQVINNYELTSNSQQLQQIMARLDSIDRQQQQILKELASLKQTSSNTVLHKLKLIQPQSEEMVNTINTK